MKIYFAVLVMLLPFASLLTGCGSGSGSSVATVSGKASFVQGGSTATRARGTPRSGHRLSAGDDYLISPNQAKITFTSIVFRDATGATISTSTLTNCVVTYDRASPSGTSLLDCPFDVPVGEIAQIAVGFSTTIQILVNDTTTGIYSHATGFDTNATTPDFASFVVTAGASSSERSTPIIFASPITVASGTTPQIFITTDMIHGTQLKVDAGGTTLSVPTAGTQDPVALFGGPSKGHSSFFSESTTIESVKVAGKKSVRVFYDADDKPLYLIGYTCGVDGPKGAWASPPVGATLGGWLGKDSTDKIAWALPTDTSYASYSAFFVMPDQTTLNATTTLDCKASASPPAPADGKTYASGAPALTAPTTSTVLRLLAK